MTINPIKAERYPRGLGQFAPKSSFQKNGSLTRRPRSGQASSRDSPEIISSRNSQGVQRFLGLASIAERQPACPGEDRASGTNRQRVSALCPQHTENATFPAVAEPGGTVEVKSTQIILSERPVSPSLRVSYKTRIVC